jgi:hypothetical protein
MIEARRLKVKGAVLSWGVADSGVQELLKDCPVWLGEASKLQIHHEGEKDESKIRCYHAISNMNTLRPVSSISGLLHPCSSQAPYNLGGIRRPSGEPHTV